MDMTFTDSAISKIKEAIAEESKPNVALRMFVSGGGCSGFQYGFTLDEKINEDDFIFEKDGVKVLVDGMSYQYLAGATVEYEEDLMGARFVIKNPNATGSCGCGSSFTAD